MAKQDHTKIFLMASLYDGAWQESFENRFVLKQHKSFNKLGNPLSIYALPKEQVPDDYFKIKNSWKGLLPLMSLNRKSKSKLCNYYLQNLSGLISETDANEILDKHTDETYIEENFYLLNSVYAYTEVNDDKSLKKREKAVIKALGDLMAYSYPNETVAKILFDISSIVPQGTSLSLEAVGLHFWKDIKKSQPDTQGLCVFHDGYKKWLLPEPWVNQNARKLLTKTNSNPKPQNG